MPGNLFQTPGTTTAGPPLEPAIHTCCKPANRRRQRRTCSVHRTAGRPVLLHRHFHIGTSPNRYPAIRIDVLPPLVCTRSLAVSMSRAASAREIDNYRGSANAVPGARPRGSPGSTDRRGGLSASETAIRCAWFTVRERGEPLRGNEIDCTRMRFDVTVE